MEQIIDRELSKKQQLNKSQRRRAANKKKQRQKQEHKAARPQGESGTKATEERFQPEPEPEPEPEPDSSELNTAEVETARSTFCIERTLWEHEGIPRVSLLRGSIAWQQCRRNVATISTSCTHCKSTDTPPPRRHQLRRHLSGISHPVLGDTQYGKGRINRCVQKLDKRR